VLPAAQEIGREIATNCAPASVAITKKLMYRFLMENDRDAAHTIEGRAYLWTGKQPDSREGVTAFLEKRPPEWKVDKNDLPEEAR
jgi:enoyl-CoA hydratase/carnithine racemase